MYYPLIIFSEWKIVQEPIFQKMKDGNEYCVFTISKNFKTSDGQFFRDTARIQCFGDDCEHIKFLLSRSENGLKDVLVDIVADRVPYFNKQSQAIEYSYKASKVSRVGNKAAVETLQTQKPETSLIDQMDKNPFGE